MKLLRVNTMADAKEYVKGLDRDLREEGWKKAMARVAMAQVQDENPMPEELRYTEADKVAEYAANPGAGIANLETRMTALESEIKKVRNTPSTTYVNDVRGYFRPIGDFASYYYDNRRSGVSHFPAIQYSNHDQSSYRNGWDDGYSVGKANNWKTDDSETYKTEIVNKLSDRGIRHYGRALDWFEGETRHHEQCVTIGNSYFSGFNRTVNDVVNHIHKMVDKSSMHNKVYNLRVTLKCGKIRVSFQTRQRNCCS